MNCGKILQVLFCSHLEKSKKSKPMAYQNQTIDTKANELTLTLQGERRHSYALCYQPGPDAAYNLKPEWLKVPDAVRVSGLGRSTIYNLIKLNKIKSFSNRQRGAQRGSRFISYDSLVGYMEAAYQNSLSESKIQNGDAADE